LKYNKTAAAIILAVSSTFVAGCGLESRESSGQKIFERWTKPISVTLPEGVGEDAKGAKTYLYWENARRLVDSLYGIPLDGVNIFPDGTTTQSLMMVSGKLCGVVAAEIQSLPVNGVDEDAIEAVMRVMNTLAIARDHYTTSGDFQILLSIDKDPTESGSAEADLRRVRALLESRYDSFQFAAFRDNLDSLGYSPGE